MHIQTEQQPYLIYNETTFDAKERDILLKLDIQQRYCSHLNTKNGASNLPEISLTLVSQQIKKKVLYTFFPCQAKGRTALQDHIIVLTGTLTRYVRLS